MAKLFIWLFDSQTPRKGPTLIKGKEHKAADYEPTAIKRWHEQKALKFVEGETAKSKEKEKG